MGRYVAPDRGVKETVIGGRKYNPDKTGIYNVETPSHGAAMKREGFIEASLNPVCIVTPTAMIILHLAVCLWLHVHNAHICETSR